MEEILKLEEVTGSKLLTIFNLQVSLLVDWAFKIGIVYVLNIYVEK